MSKDQSSYRSIMKATSIFGGVQVFNILIRIIRSKFVAILLGPLGIGIADLLNSTIGLISSITNFGLETSAVRDIAEAGNDENFERISVVVKTVRKLVWFTGLLGAVITFVLSPWLSKVTFGNSDYTFAFMWVSITLLFNQISSGQRVILQGLRKLQYLAKASLIGSLLGLIIVIPLYYFYGVDGIVPGIIVTSLITLVLTWYFSSKIKIQEIELSISETLTEGKNMMILGLAISVSGFLTLGSSLLLRIFISHNGGIEQVGLFTAGFVIINTYVGLVFTAMGTDYYPRLSAIANDNNLVAKAVNQQAEIAILILGPILIAFMVFINWIIIILYSKEFLVIDEMIHWASLGIFFKALSWTISFIFLAKGDSKLFFWNELLSNVNMLILNIIGYYYWGLSGLGISFLISYFLYLVQVYLISKYKYKFSFTKDSIKIFIIQFVLATIVFLIVKYLNNDVYLYAIGIVIIALSSWYSYRELDQRMDIKNLLSKFLKKK